jgi:colanic acid biosynthesis glycosyl transferase WcaI
VRILIHGLNFAPELIGVGKFTGEMAEWLAERGHEVRVVTAPPFNPSSRVFPGYSAWLYRREDRSYPVEQGDAAAAGRKHTDSDGGVLVSEPIKVVRVKAGTLSVFRCPVWVPKQPSASKRALHLASFAASSFCSMLRQTFWKPQVVVAIEPTLMCAPSAWIVARIAGARSWLHIQDFEVDAAFELGLLTSSSRFKQLAARIETTCTSAFDHVSTISDKMWLRLSQKNVKQERCVLFPNWVDTGAIFPMQHRSQVRAELGIADDGVVALYSGAMGRKQGLELLAATAARLVHMSSLHFIFCGGGPAKDMLLTATSGLKNVHVLDLQPAERLNELLNAADIHLLPQRSDAADLVMPSKLTGMLASGRPVVATAASGTQVAEVVEGRGIVVPPDNLRALTWAIEQLANHPNLRERLGDNARAYAVSVLDKKLVLERFEQELLKSLSDHVEQKAA